MEESEKEQQEETKKELQREIEIYLRERRQRERARERVMETKIAVVVKQKQDWVRFHFCAGESRERGSMCVYVCLELFVVAIVVLRSRADSGPIYCDKRETEDGKKERNMKGGKKEKPRNEQKKKVASENNLVRGLWCLACATQANLLFPYVNTQTHTYFHQCVCVCACEGERWESIHCRLRNLNQQ